MALSQAEINKLLRDANAIKNDAKKILDDEVKRTGALTDEIKKSNSAYKEKVRLLREINEQIQNSRTISKEQISDLMQQEQSLKGLTGIQASFVDSERKRLEYSKNGLDMYPATEAKLSSIASLNQELLGLSAEDVISRAEIIRQIESQMGSMKNLGKDAKYLLDIEKNKFETAKNISALTEGEQEQLEKQISAYKSIKDAIGGVLDTASVLTKTVGGVVGSLIVGAGYITEALGKTTREMGGFVGGLTGATSQVTLLGTIFPNALESAKGLQSEFGGIEQLSFQTKLNTSLMATNMGISGEQAAQLTGNFARLNGGSIETAQNLAESTKQLAKANGLMPSAIMADVASSAKAFAEYGAQGGQNIGEAAVAAAKLGVNMGTLTNVTDNLLDFESSITKELELGAMLGRNINLNKARQLAYEGKIGASVKEALNQMGGIEAFNRMDIFQKRAAAAALGLSTDELQKMASNMDKLNDDGTMQLSTFDSMKESLTAFATGPLGSSLKGFGSMVIATGQMNMGLQSMGTSIGGMVRGLGRGLKHLIMYPIHLAKAAAIKIGGAMGIGAGVVGKYGAGSIAAKGKDAIADKGKDLVKDKMTDSIKVPDAPKGPAMGAKLKDLAGGLKAMGTPQVLFGALNLIPTALGFAAMTLGAIGLAAVALGGSAAGIGLRGLGRGLKAMGTPQVLFGALNLIPTAIGMVAMIAAIPGLIAISLFGVPAEIGLRGLGRGLKAMGTPQVLFGALNLIPTAIGMVAMIAAIPGLIAISLFGVPAGIGLRGLGRGLKAMGTPQVLFGALNLLPTALGFAAMTLGAIGLAAVALGGIAAGIGLSGLAVGLSVLGGAAPVGIIGVGLLAAFGVALIPLTYALSLLSPLLEAFGTIITSVFSGVGTIIDHVTTSIVTLMDNITLEKVASIGLLSLAFMGLAGSLYLLGLAGLFALPTLLGIAAASAGIAIVAELFGLGGENGGSEEASGLEEGSLSEYQTEMLAQMQNLIAATVAPKDFIIDGQKFGKYVTKNQRRDTTNNFQQG